MKILWKGTYSLMKKVLSRGYIFIMAALLGLPAISEENDGVTYFRPLDDSPVYVEAEPTGFRNRLSNIKTIFHKAPKYPGIELDEPAEPAKLPETTASVIQPKTDENIKPVSKIIKPIKNEKTEQKIVQEKVELKNKVSTKASDNNLKAVEAVKPRKTPKPAVKPKPEPKIEDIKISEEQQTEQKRTLKTTIDKPVEEQKEDVKKEITKPIITKVENQKQVESTEDKNETDVLNQATYSAEASKSDASEETKKQSKRHLSLFKKKDKQQENIVNNKLYLDRFREDNQADTEAYYKARNLLVKPNGEVELILQSDDEKGIDTLIKEIEATSPDDTFTPPIKLSLKDSIGIAIAKHPSIKSARLSADIYKARIIEAWASYFPTFSANFDIAHNYTKLDHYKPYRSNTGTIPNVSAGLLLFDFGKTKTNVDIAKVDYSASKYDLQDTINELIYSVKAAYYDVLFAQHQVDVYNKTIEEFDLQVRSAKKFFSIGKKAEIDVITAEYNAGNARLNLVKANNTLENAKVTFANTLGLPEFANFTLSDELPRVEYKTDLETLLQDAFYIRPDLISAEKALENAKLSVRRAWRAFTPDITANGTGGYARADNMGTTSYAISANMNYSINYLELKKGLDIAKISYEKAKSDYELKKQSVYLEVKKAYIDLKNTLNTVYQADENMASAKAQSYHATGRYNAGLSTAIELKDSENTYMNSQLEYYDALLNYNNAVANLERVVGKPINSIINDQTQKNNEAAQSTKTEKTKSKNKRNKSEL